jgi:hypothetical protein
VAGNLLRPRLPEGIRALIAGINRYRRDRQWTVQFELADPVSAREMLRELTEARIDAVARSSSEVEARFSPELASVVAVIANRQRAWLRVR